MLCIATSHTIALSMLFDIVLVLAVAYAVQMLVFIAGVALARYPSSGHLRPAVSVIIAARNEEKNIGPCLDSMTRLSYPEELLEVIVIDDRSEDATRSIIRSYAEAHPRVKLVVAEPGQGHLQGKTNAVSQGIEASHGEILLFTDADCTVPERWVEETVKYYNDERVGVVAGFTLLRARDWFSAMQALDWLVLFSVAAATVRMRYPVTAVGTNLSVRRSAYDHVGGYRTIPFSITEDYALFHAVTTSGYRARFPLDPATVVESAACPTWRALHRQKNRWFLGGRDMDMKSIAIYCLTFLFTLLLPIAAILDGPMAVLPALAIKVTADALLTLPTAFAFRKWRLLRAFPFYELYYSCYVLLYPILVLLGREVIWKERSFGGGGAK